MTPSPIRLIPADADRYTKLRLRMLSIAPWAFGATPEDDEGLDPLFVAQLFAQEHHATFALEAPPRLSSGEAVGEKGHHHPDLVAVASVTRANPPKFAHRARIWGVFVEPAYRGQGLGGAVMRAVIVQAQRWGGVEFLDLAVSAHSREAQHLYEGLGFVVWGREPEATEFEGCRYDELYMTLRL